jgi:hypothetical protein
MYDDTEVWEKVNKIFNPQNRQQKDGLSQSQSRIMLQNS